MYHNFRFDTISDALPVLFNALLEDGIDVGSRNGRTLELSFAGITLKDGAAREILVPGRKHNLAAQIAETMWVLSGRNDIEWLSHYLPRAKDFSDDGKIWRGGYGPRIRQWESGGGKPFVIVDQLEHVVELLRRSPGTRQAVIGIYDPAIDTEPGLDIPCNDFLHFLSRAGTLDLHIFVRSNDAMWGWSGINVFEWSSLLEIVAGMVGLDVGSLHFSVSSFHLYDKHFGKAQKIADVGGPHPQHHDSPRFNSTGLDDMSSFHELCHQWFRAETFIRNEAASGPLSTEVDNLIEDFPEPMLQSWLRVLAWWWTGNTEYLVPLAGTNLAVSAVMAIQPKTSLTPVPAPRSLIDRIVALHNEKDAAYGNSWCRRGEMLGIMANIARKIDRLGGAETSDESSLDTAMDLFVYLGKYLAWTANGGRDEANNVLYTVERAATIDGRSRGYLEQRLRDQFDSLEEYVVDNDHFKRDVLLTTMIQDAWNLVVGMEAK